MYKQCKWKMLNLSLGMVACLAASAFECEKENLASTSFLQRQLSLQHERSASAFPWDRHIFIVGTGHKAGSHLLHRTMLHVFNILGATLSCQYGENWNRGDGITALNSHNLFQIFPAPLRYHNGIDRQALEAIRSQAKEMKADLRGVMIVRNPMDMVLSAYVYHHRGAEPGNPLQRGMQLMGPEEGVPEMARRMLPVIEGMTSAFEVAQPDTLVLKYENFTASSKMFDATVEKIINSLFRDEITNLQKAEILMAARLEDLNRQDDELLTTRENEMEQAQKPNATNDEAEMEQAQKSVHLIAPDIYGRIMHSSAVLGYA